MSEKVIQLTNRMPEAKWKSFKNGKKKEVNMSDMTDYQLQAAIIIVQKRALKNFMVFLNDKQREVQLKKAAKDRNMDIKNIDDIKVNYLGAKFTEYEEPMNSAYNSANRKIKQEAKI